MGHVLVQEGVVEGLHHQLIHQLLQGSQVADHAGAGIDRATDGHIQQVVVAMAMGPGALAVDGLVLLLAEFRPGQAMGCGEVGANGQESFHGVADNVGPERVGFVEAQAHQWQLRRQPAPDAKNQGFGGRQHARGLAEIELGPGSIEVLEIQLGGHLLADGVLDVGEVEHHPIGIEGTAHRHDQRVVVTVARGQAAGTETSLIVFRAQLRQPVTVAGAEGGAPGDHTGATLAVGTNGGRRRIRRGRRHHRRCHDSARREAAS